MAGVVAALLRTLHGVDARALRVHVTQHVQYVYSASLVLIQRVLQVYRYYSSLSPNPSYFSLNKNEFQIFLQVRLASSREIFHLTAFPGRRSARRHQREPALPGHEIHKVRSPHAHTARAH